MRFLFGNCSYIDTTTCMVKDVLGIMLRGVCGNCNKQADFAKQAVGG